MIHASTLDIVAQNQLNVLIHLAKADRDFTEPERNLIYRVCREKNFPEERLVELMSEPRPIESLGALSPNQKFQYLMNCIEMILVDSNIRESEMIFCRSIAIKLGFKKGVVDYLLSNLATSTPEELRTETFTAYAA